MSDELPPVGPSGASAREVESAIATPAERVMSEIQGVEDVYSVSRQGQAVITVQFEVGIPRQEALVRLYNQVYSNQDWLPANLGATQPSALLSLNLRSRSGQLVPLVIMAPIPLKLIGIMPGHALLGREFTATSMIGMIALTAISAMVGAYFILNDPIFNGLAISMVFGLAMSTLLTVIVVPLLYYVLARRKWL